MCQVLFYASESISEQSNNHYPSLPSDGGNKKWIIMIKIHCRWEGNTCYGNNKSRAWYGDLVSGIKEESDTAVNRAPC